MEIKKSETDDFEQKKPILRKVGLVLSLSILLFCCEYFSILLILYLFNHKSSGQNEKISSFLIQEELVQKSIIPIDKEVNSESQIQNKSFSNNFIISDKNTIIKDVINFSENNYSSKNQVYQTIEQEPTIDKPDTGLFILIEEIPLFPGGEENLVTFFKENVKYPPVAREKSNEGIVYIQFYVEKDGSISNPSIINDIGGGCAEEALRVVKIMPKWYPGKRRGKSFKSQFVLPIKFILS
jgi:protein TonB